MNKTASPGEPYILYRYYDERDILIYIGISGGFISRQRTHMTKSRWMPLAVRSTIQRCDTVGELEEAERVAIATERPIFNVQHNDTPEARERLRAYLEDIGRPDLLVTPRAERQVQASRAPESPLSGPAPEPTCLAEAFGWPQEPGPLPSRLISGSYRILISHDRGVTLSVAQNGVSTAIKLSSDLAWELGDALKRHAESDFVEHGATRAAVHKEPAA